MEFRILGPLEVWHRQIQVWLQGQRQRSLLAALLLEPDRLIMLDRLVDTLWDNDPPETARQQVRNSVSALRRDFAAQGAPPDLVQSRSGGYVVHLVSATLDVQDFQERRNRAAVLSAHGEIADALSLLRQALALWRGPALAGLTGIVLQSFAARLNEQRLATLEECVELELSCGRHRDVVDELSALVGEHPLRERLVEHLMLALYRSGRPADALRCFHQTRQQLAEELGIDPSEPLCQLYQAILQSSPSLGAAERAERFPRVRWTGLRCPVTRVIGRDTERSRLGRLLAERRLVAVTGVAGCGKSTVALRTAEDVASSFSEVMVISLVELRSTNEMVRSLAAQCDLRSQRPDDQQSTLERRLASGRVLLVLDNCEHLSEEIGAWAGQVLSVCPGLTILATSRQPLGAPEEVVWSLAPFPVPDAFGASDVDNPAVQLFLERARDASSAFAPAGADFVAIVDICRRLDGIPLALELAAAKVRALSLGEIAERLNRDMTLLSAGTPGRDRRHRTMLSAVEWSFEQLSESQQGLLVCLSTFAGRFSVRAVESLYGDFAPLREQVAADLAALVDRSLVHVDGQRNGSQQHRLLRPIREYAAGLVAN